MPSEIHSVADAPETIPRQQLDAHRAMVLWLFVATAIVSGLLGVALWLTDPTLSPWLGSGKRQTSVLLIVGCAGALGGFVSCLRRLYAFEDVFPRNQYADLFGKFNLYLIAYSTIPPLIGVIAASTVYGIFAGGLLSGSVFPIFACADGGNECKTLPEFLGYWRPAGAKDYAKAMVWGFVAGFSERFFVDILNQFGGKAGTRQAAG